jgi:chromosome segregation ATPase
MPPRAAGQLDQISEAIGEIRGTVAGIERYIHEERHGVRNLGQKVEGLSSQMSREIAAAKGEIGATLSTAIERVEARIQTIDDRVSALESSRQREEGARGFLVWFLQSPLVGWLAAAALFAAAWWKGQIK